MITFRLEAQTGQPAYRQLVQQVKHALRVGILALGDQLPTVKEVVSELAINPNTVLKAYRELELQGLVQSRPGRGTFVVGTVPGIPPSVHAALRRALLRWVGDARAAGADDEAMHSMFAESLNQSAQTGAA